MKNLFVIFSMLISSIAFSQSKISGVVTFYFNQYQGDKPDIGSKVEVISVDKSKNFDIKLFDTLSRGSAYYNLYESYELIVLNDSIRLLEYKKKPKKYTKEIEDLEIRLKDNIAYRQSYLNTASNYGCNTKAGVNRIDKILSQEKILKINNSEDVIERIVDGSGNYSINVPPGEYLIFITSNNRKGYLMSSVMGYLYCKKVTIKADSQVDVSHKFSISDY